MKKSSGWLLLSALLIILLIAGYLWNKKNHVITQTVNPVVDTHGVNSNNSVLTDFNAIYKTENIADLENRPIEVNNLVVRKVLSDKVFLVSSDEKNSIQLYVFRDIPVDSNLVKVALRPGLRVDVVGTMHRALSFEDIQSKWGLGQNDAKDAANRLVYAESTNVTQTPPAR
jgi:hypothetical protein